MGAGQGASRLYCFRSRNRRYRHLGEPTMKELIDILIFTAVLGSGLVVLPLLTVTRERITYSVTLSYRILWRRQVSISQNPL